MAMTMKRPQQVKVGRTIEWTTIPVYYIYIGVTVLLVTLSVGGYFTYQALFGPRNVAARALAAAESAFDRASELFRPQDHEDTIRQAEAKLEEARGAFGQSQWEISKIAAEESERLSKGVIAEVGAEGQSVANFKRLSGRIEVKKATSTQWIVASPDTLLGPNDLVRTDGDSRAEILYNNGTKLVVEPGTLIQINRSQSAKDSTVEVPAGRVTTYAGRIGKNLLKASDTEVDVAPGSVTEVSTKDEQVAVSVGQGEARVKRGDDQVKVQPNELVIADRSGLGEVERLPEQPKPPQNMQIFEYATGTTSRAVIRWEPVPEAVKYVVEVGTDQLLAGKDVQRIEVASSSFELEGYPDGDYFWRVVAENAQRRRSLWTDPQSFHIGKEGVPREPTAPPTQIPSLKIKSATPYGTTLIIQGSTDPNVRLSVDGESVEVKSNGEFHSVTSLRDEGRNEVVVMARNAVGGVRKTTIIVIAQFY